MTTKTNPLLDAADYITENGWCRNSFLNQQGQVCLAGAVGAVTGAILPLTDKELKREINVHVKEYGYTPEEAKVEVAYFKWSKSKAKLRAYRQALTALASEIDASQVQSVDNHYTDPDTYSWESDPAKRQDLAENAFRNRVEGIVIQRNDGVVGTEKGVRPRTTKRQAVALLKRAAKRI